MKKNENEKKAASKIVALTAAAGMLISSAFSSPAELLKQEDSAIPPPPAAVVEYAAPDASPDDDGDDVLEPEEESEEKLSFRARLRRRILRMPQAVRAVIGVPLWGVGWGITSLLSLIWTGLLSPAFGVILKWIVAAALLFLAVILTVKAVFPDIPLKKLINKRNFLTVFIGMAVLAAADTVLGIALPDKEYVSLVVKSVGSLGVMAVAVVPAILSENKKRRMESVESPAEEIAQEHDYRAEVLAIADSVK